MISLLQQKNRELGNGIPRIKDREGRKYAKGWLLRDMLTQRLQLKECWHETIMEGERGLKCTFGVLVVNDEPDRGGR